MDGWGRTLWTWLAGTSTAPLPTRGRSEAPRQRERAGGGERSEGVVDHQAEVLARLDGLLAGSGDAQDTLTLEVLRGMVEAGQVELPRLPALALQLQALELDGPEDSHHIAALVQTDRDVTACVMEAASAVRFGGTGVRTLEHAIVRLGLSTVQSIAIGASAHAVIYRIPGYDEESNRLGQQALVCARACHALARGHRQEPGVAFLAGLFHDVGEVLVLRALSLVRARTRGDDVSLRLQQLLCHHLHVPLGAWFAQARALPPPVRDSIAFHHDPVDPLSGLVWAVQHLQHSPAEDGGWPVHAPPLEQVRLALEQVQGMV